MIIYTWRAEDRLEKGEIPATPHIHVLEMYSPQSVPLYALYIPFSRSSHGADQKEFLSL